MENEKYKILIFFIIISLLLSSLSGFIVAILYKYQKKYLSHNKAMEKIKMDHQTALLESKLEIQENTMAALAKEVHDNIGLTLTLAKISISKASQEEQAVHPKLIEANNLLSNAIIDLRNLSRTLNSDYIIKNGLVKSIEREISLVSKIAKFSTKYKLYGDEFFFDSNKEIIVFRIFQETLNNAIKHSKGTQLNINLHYTPEEMKIEIIDNGEGFDFNCSNASYSGLSNMIQRAKMLKGCCTIESSIGLGTTVIITIPIKPLNNDKSN